MLTTITNIEDFEKLEKKSETLVIDFSASWCGPCRMMKPIFDEISTENNFNCEFATVDIDECEKLAEKFSIMYVPTFLILKNGNEIARTSGYMEKDKFEDFLKQNLKIEK